EPVARAGHVVDPHLVPAGVAAVGLDRARRLQLALVEERPEDGGDPGVEPGDREHPGAEPAGRRHALEAELAGAEVARPGRWPGRAAQPVTPRPDVGHALLGGHRRLPSIAPGRAVRLSRATPSRARTGRPR